MSITKRFSIEIYDVGSHPQTGAAISAYKCTDVSLERVVLSGIAQRDEIESLCRWQLELLTLTVGGDWTIGIEIVSVT